MKKFFALFLLLILNSVALADEALVAPPCAAFGTTSGTCLQGAGALGTPSSGTVTNLTGTASININGTVGATTAATGAFTTLSASGAASIGALTVSAQTSSFRNTDWNGSSVGTALYIQHSAATGNATADIQVYNSGGSTGGALRFNNVGGNITLGSAGVAVLMPGLASSSAAQTGTLCWTTGTGNITVDTTTTCLLSAGKYKHDIKPLNGSSLAKVAALRPVSYEYNSELAIAGEQIGLLAEDVAAIDDRLVSHDPVDGSVRAVRYQQLTAVLAGAIKELKSDNDNLRQCQENWKCRIFGMR